MSEINVKEYFINRFCGNLPKIYPDVQGEVECAEIGTSAYHEGHEKAKALYT